MAYGILVPFSSHFSGTHPRSSAAGQRGVLITGPPGGPLCGPDLNPPWPSTESCAEGGSHIRPWSKCPGDSHTAGLQTTPAEAGARASPPHWPGYRPGLSRHVPFWGWQGGAWQPLLVPPRPRGAVREAPSCPGSLSLGHGRQHLCTHGSS